MSFIPSQFPVTMTDGSHEYQVFDASAFGDAMFGLGHRIKEDPELTIVEAKPKRGK